MQAAAIKIHHLLEKLEQEDYDKEVSYIEFLVDTRKKAKRKKKSFGNREEIEAAVASLVGAIPDVGKTLEEYRDERLK
ncbi:MAG: hypothetical protein HFG58_15950 [Lachnospiraceae bacterium]|jgi:hypothetical protein|nr:hypothetical protein [Lachnospiraceae bacterium]